MHIGGRVTMAVRTFEASSRPFSFAAAVAFKIEITNPLRVLSCLTCARQDTRTILIIDAPFPRHIFFFSSRPTLRALPFVPSPAFFFLFLSRRVSAVAHKRRRMNLHEPRSVWRWSRTNFWQRSFSRTTHSSILTVDG